MSKCYRFSLQRVNELDQDRARRKAELMEKIEAMSTDDFEDFLGLVNDCMEKATSKFDESKDLLDFCCLIGLLEIEEVIAEYGLKLSGASND